MFGFFVHSLPVCYHVQKIINVSSLSKFMQACIWDFFNKQKHNILISSSQTLEESNLQMDQDVSSLWLYIIGRNDNLFLYLIEFSVSSLKVYILTSIRIEASNEEVFVEISVCI